MIAPDKRVSRNLKVSRRVDAVLIKMLPVWLMSDCACSESLSD